MRLIFLITHDLWHLLGLIHKFFLLGYFHLFIKCRKHLLFGRRFNLYLLFHIICNLFFVNCSFFLIYSCFFDDNKRIDRLIQFNKLKKFMHVLFLHFLLGVFFLYRLRLEAFDQIFNEWISCIGNKERVWVYLVFD